MLVTGTTSGLGLAASRALAGAGARVVMTARDAERGRAAVADLGRGAELVVLDLADLCSVRRAADDVRERTCGRPPPRPPV